MLFAQASYGYQSVLFDNEYALCRHIRTCVESAVDLTLGCSNTRILGGPSIEGEEISLLDLNHMNSASTNGSVYRTSLQLKQLQEEHSDEAVANYNND